MGKHSPVDKHPDGKGNRGGGNVCTACGGAGGRWERSAQVVNGKAKSIDVYKPCGGCGK